MTTFRTIPDTGGRYEIDETGAARSRIDDVVTYLSQARPGGYDIIVDGVKRYLSRRETVKLVHGIDLPVVRRLRSGTKLTEDDVREIRASGDSQRAIGERFGISPAMVNHIKKGSRWSRVA